MKSNGLQDPFQIQIRFILIAESLFGIINLTMETSRSSFLNQTCILRPTRTHRGQAHIPSTNGFVIKVMCGIEIIIISSAGAGGNTLGKL